MIELALTIIAGAFLAVIVWAIFLGAVEFVGWYVKTVIGFIKFFWLAITGGSEEEMKKALE